MIALRIEVSTAEEGVMISNKLHEEFRGWSSYINSDVLIATPGEAEVLLLLGPKEGVAETLELKLVSKLL